MLESRRRGFTMVETIMVAAIVAVIAATGGPRLAAALQRRTATSAADQFLLTHSLARSTALRYGRVAQLHIDAGGRRFWVDVDTSASGIGQRATIGYVRYVNGNGLTMTSTRALICFDAQGLASTSGSCEPGDSEVIFGDGATSDTIATTAIGKLLR